MVKTEHVSYENFILDALKDSQSNNIPMVDDYWYAPIEDREISLMEDSIKRGALYLANKAA